MGLKPDLAVTIRCRTSVTNSVRDQLESLNGKWEKVPEKIQKAIKDLALQLRPITLASIMFESRKRVSW
jgi:hypothetical protein